MKCVCVNQGGVDAVIDLLESCPPFQRGQVLGCLADLSLNPNVTPYLRIWKSDVNGRSFASLLLRFWGEGEAQQPVGPGSSVAEGSSTDSPGLSAFDRLRRALKASKVRACGC